MSSKTEISGPEPVSGLLDDLQQQLATLPETRRWMIALSGGLDSSLLLELMSRLSLAAPLAAIHIDHQLQAESPAWAEHCRRECQRLGIELQTHQVTPASASEADAREARYRVFEACLRPGDCLLLAQHADDQAETLLLRLLRGAGVTGLAGMPRTRPLGAGRLLRPLLDQPRTRLEQAARAIGLKHVEDPSNRSSAYDRNFLRLELMPKLKQRWPALLTRLGETGQLMEEASELLQERAEEDLAACLQEGGVDLDRLDCLSPARQRNLLHHWISRISGHRVSRARLLQLERDLLGARDDAQPIFRLSGYQIRRYRRRLYLLPDPLPAVENPFRTLLVGERVMLPLGWLEWQPAERGLPAGQPLELTFRQGGERLRPEGRGGSVSLKQLLQEAGLPPWLRPYQPLLVRDDEILAVPGLTLCEGQGVDGGLLPFWRGFGLS